MGTFSTGVTVLLILALIVVLAARSHRIPSRRRVRRVRRILRKARPFKGTWAYEVQLLNVVLMWYHDSVTARRHESCGTRIMGGRFRVWLDPYWRL